MSRTARVWAPRASKVDVVVGGEAQPMAAQDGGWWSAELATGGPEAGRPARSTAGRDRLRLPAGRRPDRAARPAIAPATRRC